MITLKLIRSSMTATLKHVLGFLFLIVSLSATAEVVIVLDSGDGTITRIDRSTFQVIDHFYVGREPHHLMSTPDNSALIVANAASNNLVFLNPQTGDIQSKINGISDPYQIGFSPNKKFFVANSLRLDFVDIYQASDFKLIKRFSLPTMPSHMAFTPDSHFVFVSLQGTSQLVAINLDTLKVQWQIPIGETPAGVIMTPDGQYVLVGVMGPGEVAVVDLKTAKIVKHIPTGAGAHNFTPMGDHRHLLISNRSEDTISVIDTKTLTAIKKIKVPGGPDCMEVALDHSQLWITSRFIKKVEVYQLPDFNLIHTISVGKSPHGVFFEHHAARD